MKKLFKSVVCLLLIVSCSKAKNELSSESQSNDTIAVPVNHGDWLEDGNKIDSVVVVDSVDTKELEKNKCFKSDSEVLTFFNGKTFSRITVNFEDYWTFHSDRVVRTCWQKKMSTERYKGDSNDEPKYQYWDYREIIYKYVSYRSSMDGTEGIAEYSNTPNDDRPFTDTFNCQKNYLHSTSGLDYELGVLGKYPGDGLH